MMKSKIKIALVQQEYQHDMEDVICTKIQQASKEASLILLSELSLHPYFCQEYNYEHFKIAQKFEYYLNFFATLARENSIVLLANLFEERTRGLFHNTAVVFEKDGSIAGKYRKMHIPDDPNFYEKFYFAPGDEFKPIDTSVGRLGILICWDQWYPEAARIMALSGADILIYPTAIGFTESDTSAQRKAIRDAWITIQRSHAIANGLPLASINRIGREMGKESYIEFFGSSFICDAQGVMISEIHDRNEIIYAEIDHDNSAEVRKIWPFLRDRRVDAYADILLRYKDI